MARQYAFAIAPYQHTSLSGTGFTLFLCRLPAASGNGCNNGQLCLYIKLHTAAIAKEPTPWSVAE